MMVNFGVHKNIISYSGCATHLAMIESFIIAELFISSTIAYDRYVAIWKPLRYMVIMADMVCWGLVIVPYLCSTFVSMLFTVKLFMLPFCVSNIIRCFYCDCFPLMTMFCSDMHELELIILIFSGCNLLSSCLVFSYLTCLFLWPLSG